MEFSLGCITRAEIDTDADALVYVLRMCMKPQSPLQDCITFRIKQGAVDVNHRSVVSALLSLFHVTKWEQLEGLSMGLTLRWNGWTILSHLKGRYTYAPLMPDPYITIDEP